MLSKVKASSKLFIPIQGFWWICFLRSNFGANSTFLALMQMQKIYIFKASFCCCCCSVIQSCPILCNPMDCSKPGFPVLHHLPELGQTHVHQVGDAIELSHPLLPSSPPAFNLSQLSESFPMSQFFASCGQSIGASASVLPINSQY